MSRRLAPALLLPALVPAALVLPALVLAALVPAAGGGGTEEASGGGGTVAAEGLADARTAVVVADRRLELVASRTTAKAGTLALTRTIEGGVPHDLVCDEDTVGEDLPVVGSGSRTSTCAFPRPGTHDLACALHPGRDGTVVVS